MRPAWRAPPGDARPPGPSSAAVVCNFCLPLEARAGYVAYVMLSDFAAQPCPCGTGAPLSSCCGSYLEGRGNPPTAQALMRSRYTAFVLGDADYLLATWDPGQRPAQLDLKQDRTQWLGLQILGCEAGGVADDHGRVLFLARYRLEGQEQSLRENSRFRKVAGRWLYVDGQAAPGPGDRPAAARPSTGRNDPCPCGSGQKYKRCCGK